MSGRIQTTQKGPIKMPIIGKIKVGDKSPSSGIPITLDYFRATGDYAGRFHETFGEKPTSISIIFMSDDISQSCNERFELRDEKTGNLCGSGDGIDFMMWNPELKEYEPFKADTEEAKAKLAATSKFLSNGGKWKAILTIEFVIPKIASVMGLWKLETKGVLSSIPNIRDTFDTVKEFAGTVVNIPFDLQIKKVKSQRPGDKRLYPVVTLIPNVSKDKLDDVRSFIDQGNNLRDIKGFLEGGKMPDFKQLENIPKPKELESGNNVQAVLFDNQQ